jgi:hypothetical protein
MSVEHGMFRQSYFMNPKIWANQSMSDHMSIRKLIYFGIFPAELSLRTYFLFWIDCKEQRTQHQILNKDINLPNCVSLRWWEEGRECAILRMFAVAGHFSPIALYTVSDRWCVCMHIHVWMEKWHGWHNFSVIPILCWTPSSVRGIFDTTFWKVDVLPSQGSLEWTRLAVSDGPKWIGTFSPPVHLIVEREFVSKTFCTLNMLQILNSVQHTVEFQFSGYNILLFCHI